MHEVKLSSKNQIVIPREVRSALRVNAGDKMVVDAVFTWLEGTERWMITAMAITCGNPWSMEDIKYLPIPITSALRKRMGW